MAVREWRALGRTLVRRGGAMEEEFLQQRQTEDPRAEWRERLLEG
jgi:hypothetical protein